MQSAPGIGQGISREKLDQWYIKEWMLLTLVTFFVTHQCSGSSRKQNIISTEHTVYLSELWHTLLPRIVQHFQDQNTNFLYDKKFSRFFEIWIYNALGDADKFISSCELLIPYGTDKSFCCLFFNCLINWLFYVHS